MLPSPTVDRTSEEAPPQPSDVAFVLLPSPSVNPPARLLSLVFLAGRRRRLLAKDDEGEEVAEEVDVMELGLVFLDFSPVGLVKEAGGGATLLRFSILAKSLVRLPKDSGSEQGLRNGDLLSLSLQKTTAIDPPTTEPPAPPLAPPAPKRSMPSFPLPTDAPVVLLTPSRTRTDTFDCNLPFRLPLPSFLDLLERHKSFLQPLSRSLLIFLLLFADVRPDEIDAEPDVTINDERHLLLLLLEDEDSGWPVFFDL